ncbi:MAG: hypothetical protein M3M85_02745 [bacterium]|nr:hypothetical protein [bacterium]
MDAKVPKLERTQKKKSPIKGPQLNFIERLENEEMKPDGKFPVELVRDGSYHLLECITHNEQHQSPEDKRSFVYVDEGDVHKLVNLPRDSMWTVHELREKIRSVEGIIGEPIRREAEGKIYDLTMIDGEKIKSSLPYIWATMPKFQALAERLWGGPLVPLHDKVAMNINIVPTGGEQGFHYDRNEVTILFYLNDILGGELEFRPDSKTGSQFIRTHQGMLVTLVGANKVYHQVREVEPTGGEHYYGKRITLAVSFGLPGINYEDSARDDFLYTKKAVDDQKVFDKEE